MQEIQVVAREMTDEEWADCIKTAMSADLDRELRRKVVQELVDMRMERKLRHGAMVARFAASSS